MIDPNMGYLSILLTKEAKKLLTISTPFRYYNCEELTMGVIPAADIFQTWMVGSSQPMRPDLYINIILHDKGESKKEYPIGLDVILKHWKDTNMQVNLEKSKLCTKEVEFLDFTLGQMGFMT